MPSLSLANTQESIQMIKKYWVASNGEAPLKIFFSEEEAEYTMHRGDYQYIDVFDEEGDCVQSFKLVYDAWTEDF